MTVLSAAQSAGIRLIGKKPVNLFSSSEPFSLELSDLATETATAIAKAHDWQALMKLCTLTGDGSKVAFDLPPDYDRMPKKVAVHSGSWDRWRYEPVRDLDQWQDLKTFGGTGLPGWWIMLGGQMQISTGNGLGIADGETAQFYYLSNSVTDTGKPAFSADAEKFVLPERLLTLGLIWRWRAQKRQEYAEDLRNYEIALSEEIGRDKGSQIIAVGAARWPGRVGTSYPGPLG